ncbi:IS30 family transposase [Marinobacter sp. 1Y8]
MGYRQLTQGSRYQILAWMNVGRSLRQIAQTLGCHSSTISRELKRNSQPDGYYPEQAQKASDKRRQEADKASKRAVSLVQWVRNLLEDEWSPEQIAGVMKRIGSLQVSHQWIYEMIYRDKTAGGDLWKCCRLPERRRYQRHLAKSAGLGKIPDRVGIEHRPAEIEQRLRIGDWEGDTVLKGHKESGLATVVDRRTGYLQAALLPEVKANLTADAMIRLLRPLRGAVKTLTLDNGSEFAEHRRIGKAVSAGTYFCDPYRSSQRGTNENTNGLIRQYFPKGTDFRKVTKAQLKRVVDKLNNRPRKRLGYHTPAEIFWGEYSGALDTSGAALIT